MIDITLIGTAALFPRQDRALSAALLKCGGRTVLFDCGEGTQSAARAAGVSLMRTDVIALTHYHGDHIFGLPGLLQTMFSNDRKDPLLIVGPPGVKNELEPILKLAGYVGFKIALAEMKTEALDLERYCFPPGAKLIPFRTEHRVHSVGYKFCLPRSGKFDTEKAKANNVPLRYWNRLQKGETVISDDGTKFTPDMVLGDARKGLSVVFSGDTSACKELENASRDADLLICDATYGENGQSDLAKEHGHCTFAQAAELAKRTNVKRLWLTHYSQMIIDPEDHISNAKEIFPYTECGYDGKKLTLTFEDE